MKLIELISHYANAMQGKHIDENSDVFQECIAAIQSEMGVESGDCAAHYFSDEDWFESFNQNKINRVRRIALLTQYVQYELCMGA